jgi:FKBP-type peptidyl-prolyl cis-trans isomerase
MKHRKITILTFAALLLTISISAQQPTSKSAAPATPAKLATTADTVQYTLGAYIGQWMVKNGFGITNQALFKRGMDDVMQNKPRALPDTVVAPMVASYQLTVQTLRGKQMEDQLFAALKGKPGVGALPDGVHYIPLKTGTGIRPLATDTVVINAIGIFPDGTVFEDTFQKKQTITIMTSNLIPGLNEAVQLMPEGSVWRVFVPSALAYGPTGRPNVIPPNTALVFDITLMQVKEGKKE